MSATSSLFARRLVNDLLKLSLAALFFTLGSEWRTSVTKVLDDAFPSTRSTPYGSLRLVVALTCLAALVVSFSTTYLFPSLRSDALKVMKISGLAA